jgi:hypothetical protein
MYTNHQQLDPIKILFSYTHTDEDLRDKLEKHLSSLKRSNRIACWHDRNIRAGASWSQNINTHLDTADIILLLVSPDFLDSDYCNTVEVKRALERHRKGSVCVIPVILRPVDWHDEEFAQLQALPRDAKPVEKWSNLDDALLDVTKGIKKVVLDLEAARNTP